jgi:hypothetical protein
MIEIKDPNKEIVEANYCPFCGSEEFLTVGHFDGSSTCAGCHRRSIIIEVRRPK